MTDGLVTWDVTIQTTVISAYILHEEFLVYFLIRAPFYDARLYRIKEKSFRGNFSSEPKFLSELYHRLVRDARGSTASRVHGEGPRLEGPRLEGPRPRGSTARVHEGPRRLILTMNLVRSRAKILQLIKCNHVEKNLAMKKKKML